MTELQIACLGDFQVTLAGAVLTSFQTDKSRALLAYLALERHEHPRTKLAQFLWPGYSEESARNSLRQVLYQLRQLLQDKEATAVGLPPWLLLTRQTVQLNPDAPINVDGLTFRHLLAACASHAHADLLTCATCLARMHQAVDLYRGDFLAGFTVADSAPFEEWRRITQEQFHIQMLNALTQLAAAAEAAGDDEQAIQTAHRLLTLEPWLEAAYRQIMRLLAQRGQRAAALAQYQRCRQVLAEELGVEPDEETTALYEQIRSSQVQAIRVTTPVIAPPPLEQPAAPVKPAAWLDQLPPLLGRANELIQITALLGQPTCHLVTLVGPPGVGKTRLAQAVLAESHFEHGGYFIELATLHDPTLLATTIAHALNAAHPTLQFTGERLIERLHDQALLLVLDNFEQVLSGVTLVGDLLAHCPQLKLVITSRAPLHLSGEQVITVQPLPVPDLAQPIDLTTVARNEAVQLFYQRAAAVVPGFVLTERLAPIVVEICRRLDGLPLAIELAAAHSRLLPPPALLERLTQRLALLTSRSQSRPERQQTLRAAIAWSYELLDAEEQRLFRQLTVFAGGATLSAIEAVIDSGQGTHALLAGLETLLDKSLLRHSELLPTQDEGERRVLMLETLREYGWELLASAEAGNPVTQQRHADYFLNWAETIAPKLHGPDQVIWLDRLALDHDNLRAALAWFVQANEVHKALRLATALRYFWRVRGHYREGCERLLHILGRPDAAPTGGSTDAVRARALNAAGYLQWVQGNTTAAQNLLQEALTLSRAVADAAASAFALRYLGLAADARQERASARQWLEESLAIYRTLDTPNETALALMYLGDAAFSQQAYDEAQQLYQESADLLRHLGNHVVLPYALRHLGYLALVRGNPQAALSLCTESLRLNWAAGEQQGSAAAVTALAAVAAAGERWEQAARLLACVTAWLATSGAQLLPLDRTYYEQTQDLLKQQPQKSNEMHPPAEHLALEQALAYVLQELTFADEPGRQGNKMTGDKMTGDKMTELVEATSSPFHLLPPPPPHNLPAVLTPFIGRTRALAEIVSRLQTARLLTLVGPGGMGKTRLAVEVGRERLIAFTDGVWFVPLASINTPTALAGAIATALGIAFQGDDPRSILLQSLRAKHLLLILDNFEQLLPTDGGDPSDALDLVVDLLETTSQVQILVTSRQRLNVRSERIYAVPALSFAANATLAEATALAAVRLFVQAVQRGQADFQLTDANLAAVLRICQLVQGMPLGLELAAANAVGAPLTAIADAIAQSSEFLAVEWRDLPARQRSMRAVFAWSWQLLSTAEQRALRQSAVFRGGFDHNAAQAVIGTTLPILTHLVHKSLLQWQEAKEGETRAGGNGEERYHLHELLRQFAAEELNAAGERAAVEEQHGRYYLAYLAARGKRLGRCEPKEASIEIQAEVDNIRLAWQWAATQGRLVELDQAAYAWWQFCRFQGLEVEGRQSFAAAIAGVRQRLSSTTLDETDGLLGKRLLARLLAIHANFLYVHGRNEEMTAQAREAIDLGCASGDGAGESFGVFVLGRAAQEVGRLQEADARWQQTIELVQRHQPAEPENEFLHDVHWMALNALRGSAFAFGDYAGSRAYLMQALQICQALGKRQGELISLSRLAQTNFLLYDFATAEAGWRAALELARALGYRRVEMLAQEGLGGVSRLRGDYATARRLLEQAIMIAIERAVPYEEAAISATLIRLYTQLGDQAAAEQRYEQLTQLLTRFQLIKESQLYAHLAAASKAHVAGARQEALRHAEQAHQLIASGDIPFRVADTHLILGHTRAAMEQWEAAATAFQHALAAFQQFADAVWARALAAEPRAGLAQIALAQGDLTGAQAQVEAILPVLDEQPRAGYNNPFFIYLTCYRVLAARGDARSATLLQQGYALLQQGAATLDDASRHRFLQAVPLHRELMAAYAAQQAPLEKQQSQATRASAPPLPSSLPIFSTPLVGRTQALAEINRHLQRPGVRLLTLMGPGGMGKTRLAVEIGREQMGNFADGVWFVPLAPISSATALPAAIATTLGLALQGDDPRGLLLQRLRPQRLLLILDNFEHLLAEGAAGPVGALDLVVDLLETAPGVQMLVTSRERLKLRGEQLYHLQALPFAEQATLAEAATSEAVRLFVHSVQRLQADFQLTAMNLAAVLRICQLVGGMPLGLELAAANAGSASLQAIADAIAQNIEFLAADWRDLPERQRSMRAVFAWSWRLLSAEEQRILRRSAVFRGGFDYRAAQTVTAATLPHLTRLIDKSLLQWHATATGEGRYVMHDLLQQFASEELQATGEQAAVEERHGHYYLSYLTARGVRLGRSEPKEASAEIQVELNNIRQAWQWAATQGRAAELDQAVYAWWQFCQFQGLEAEGRQSFELAVEAIRRHLLARTPGDDDAHLLAQRLLAKLLAIYANYLFAQGRDEEMAALAQEAIALGVASGGFEGETFGTFVLGRALQELDQKDEACTLWQQTIQMVRRYQASPPGNELLHEVHWMAHNWLRGSALHFGDYAGSRKQMVAALQLCQSLGKRRGELFCLAALAGVDFLLYDFAAAESGFAAALELARTLGYRRVEMIAQEGLSGVLRLRGDYHRARTLLEAACQMAAELVFPYDEALFLAALIRLDCQLGDQAAAARHHEQLTQLLARVKLAKECQLYGKLAAAVKASQAGAAAEALRQAEEADQINKNGGDILFRLVDTALILGHTRAAMGQWQAAAAFQEALAAFQQFAGTSWARILAAEPQAGLAQMALAQGDRAGARTQIEAILPLLAQEPRLGYNNPFFVYLIVYRVLVANQDERAAPLLRQGYDLLQQDAAKFDGESRQHFLTAVPWHRELVAAYAQLQAQPDKETRRQSDKESESPSHSLTLSPSHLVPAAPPHNLPVLLTPLIGRERELAEIVTRLQKPGVRLLTLSGPGGMGKTRLAVAVGRQQLAAYPDGVWFVALAALNTPTAIGPAIATALGVTMPSGEPGVALGQLLLQKRLLLILDNFEHLLSGSTEGVTLVTALLQSAPGIQILVTSRERLQLRGEQVYRVPSLTFSAHTTLAEADNATAVRVFVQYAQLNQAHFQLSADNLAAVLRICQLVQGMPLGLELAAAYVGTLPLNVIADEIAASAEFLQANWHDLVERQRSMRAIFDWSWHLLDETEQRALRKVAVFRGGFTREAAQTVADVPLAALARLGHRSLLYWEEQSAEGRYAIHELLRQFAAEQLTRSTTEQEDVAARHSAFYLNYLAAREVHLTRAEPRAAATEIQGELDNIRQAWQYAVQRRDFSALQRSAWTLFSFYRHIGALAEARHAFQALVEQMPLTPQPDQTFQRQPHSRLIAIYAYLLVFQSKFEQAITVAQQALALAQAEEDTDAVALSHFSWGLALRLQGCLADAQFHLEQTLQLASQVADATGKSELFYDVECLAGTALGALFSDWALYHQAREHFGRSLHLAQTLGKRRLETNSLLNLANLARMTGEHPTARQGYEAALLLTREVGYRWGEGAVQLELGDVVRLQGEYSHAAALLENALTILQEIGEYDKKAIALTWLGLLYAYLGDFTGAEGWLTRYQQFTDQAKGWEAAVHHLQARTVLALHRGELTQALTFATEGWQIGKTRNLPDIQAYALIGVGHAQRQLGEWTAAATAYQQAFDLYMAIQRPDQAAEAQAGLATLAQRQGDLPRALGLVEAVLTQLVAQASAGQDEPFFLYLTCYQVLAALQDPRASTILQQGYGLLQRYAAAITVDELRQSFLENVPVHRALHQAYTDFQASALAPVPRRDNIHRVVNSDKVNEDHPLIPSLPHSHPPAPLLDWNEMPIVDFLTGRSTEMAQLTAWLTPGRAGDGVPARLIAVLGMGGIGKTTLAAAVTKAVAPAFAVVIWRSLLNAPPIHELLHNWLQLLSRQTLTAPPASLDEQLRMLMGYLSAERCLLVLDNVESIFADDDPHGRAGATRPGYEGYEQLFLRLGTGEHQSCLLLTSREQPYALMRPGRQVQENIPVGRIRTLPLAGLNQQAASELLRSNGLQTSAQEAASLIDNYSGNPLALQIVAATIADFFGGDIAAFQQEGGLFDGIRLVLEQQVARLSPLERDLLIWLAIEREAVPVQILRTNFVQPRATRDLLEALQALQNRSLLEKRDSGLTLQNVIIEYTTTYLIEHVCAEILEFQSLIAEHNLSGAESKIQQSLFNRFALLKAQTKAYVRQSQVRLIVQPIVERLTVQVGKAKLALLLQRMIGLLQTSTGYAAGNLLNLLVQAGVDLRGYDFSHLTLRQVYLQGATLADVSLAYASLHQCVFTNTFGAVLAVALSPDQRLLAAASNDGVVRLWQVSDNQLYAICEGHTNVVRDVAFSPDGRWLASASLDQTVRLWEVATGQLYRVLDGHTAGVYCIAFCGNGTLIASGSRDGKIQVWDCNSGRRVRVWHEHTDAIQRLVAAPAGTKLASGSADQTIRLWEIESDQSTALFRGHTQNVSCLAFSPDGAYLASGSADQTIRLWDIATGTTRHVLHGHAHWLRAVAFSADGALLASGSADQTIRLWDATTGQVRGILQGHTNAVWALAFTADSKRLISGGTDHQLRIWDVHHPADSRTIHTIQAHVGAILALAVSHDGQLIATGDQHKLVRVWEVQSGQQLYTLAGHTDIVTAVVFSPDDRHLVSTGDDGTVRLWNLVQRQEVKTLTGHPSQAHRVAYHPNGTLIASSGHQDAVRLWELRPPAIGRLQRLLMPAASDQESAYGVAFSPDGRFLASTHGGDKLCVWDGNSGQHLYTLHGHQNGLEWLAWSPNSNLLASGDTRGNLYVWDMRTPTLTPIRHFDSRVYPWHLAFSPDSRLLASVGEDPLIRLWDVESGACVKTFSGHTQNISSVAFLPDGETLVSGGFDGTIRCWAVSSGTLLSTWPLPGPYAGLNITGVTGISDAQKMALRALGAVEK